MHQSHFQNAIATVPFSTDLLVDEQYFRLAGEGVSTQEIAQMLGVARSTIRDDTIFAQHVLFVMNAL